MSSEPPPGVVGADAAGQPQPEPQPEPQVRAAGHLHPGMLFLRLVDGLWRSILPVLIAIVAQQMWLAAAAVVFFVLSMMYALARYLTFQYRLTDEELVTTEGILHRQERRIPVDRIQDLNFVSTLLRRMVGLVVVSVETASGKGAEARLDSLSRRDAAHLREVLYGIRARRRGLEPGAVPPAPREDVLFRASASELALLGLTNNRIGAILLAVFGFIELSDELGFGSDIGGAFGGLFERLSQFSPPLIMVFVGGFLFMLLLAGWMVSVAANLVLFHGFALSQRDDVLLRRYGLITARAQSLPRRKIQRVLLEAALLRRLLGVVVVRADSAGSGMDDAEARSGRDVIAPLTAKSNGEALVPCLLPGLFAEPMPWRRVSARIVWRIFLKGVLLTAVCLGVGLPTIGAVAFVAFLIPPFAWLVGMLAYQNLAYAEIPGHVAFRWGIVGRYRAYIPLRKVQAVVLRAGPVERVLGLAALTVYVAGGSPTTLANLPRDEAERVELKVAREAARSQFVW